MTLFSETERVRSGGRARGTHPAGTTPFLALVALAMMLAGCGGEREAPFAEDGDAISTFGGGPAGGVLVALVDGEPDDLNPLTYSSNPAYQAIRLMFRALARRDSTLSGYEPDLAVAWELSGDSLARIRIRDDVRWHDGVPVTASDVAFTIERQRQAEVASPRQADVAAVRGVTVIDSTTLEVALERAGIYTLNALLEVVPVPRHRLEGTDPAQLRRDPFSRTPVGNGFYRFVRWEAGQQIILEANTEMPEGRAALDRIVIRVVPDLNAAITELLAGQGDLLKIPAEHRDRVEASRSTRVYSAPRVRPAWIAWNTRRSPLDDQRVRQALIMGVDRDRLVRGLFGPIGEVALTPIPPALWEHSPDVVPILYDPEGARVLLEAAGWIDSDADGVRDRAGVPLRIQVDYIAADQTRQDVLIAMQSMLREIGIDLVPRAYERTAWVERLRGGEFQGSSWGWGWGPGVVGPNAQMVFSSESIPPAGTNFAAETNPRIDLLLDSALVVRDSARLQRIWRDFEQLAVDDAVYTPLYLDPELFGVASRIENVRFRGIEWWEDVPYWYIPLDQRLPRDRAR